MFIIHKNWNETSIQPIPKSNSTYFMFNKKNCEICKKVIHWGWAWGNGELSKLLLGSVIWIFTSIFTSSIGPLCVGSFYLFNFLPYNCSPEKWCFPALKSLLLPQFSTYRHRTGFIVKRKQVRITNYLGCPINLLFFIVFIFSSCLFCQKKYALFKIFPEIYYYFFSKRDNWAYIYMY